MFKGIFVYGLKRNFLNALGFYIVHFLIFVALALAVGIVATVFTNSNAPVNSLTPVETVWQFIAAILVALISLLVIRAKNQLRPGYVILVILSGILALVAPGIGLILSGYLTTVDARVLA